MIRQVITVRWLKNRAACQDSIKAFEQSLSKGRSDRTIPVLKRLANKRPGWFAALFSKIAPKRMEEEWKTECEKLKYQKEFYRIDMKYVNKLAKLIREENKK